MLIIWGKKTVRKVRGRTAEFCRLCRDFRGHRAVEVLSVGHIYYLPLGRGTGQGFEIKCESCGLTHTKPSGPGAPAVSRARRLDVEALIAQTNPRGRQIWADRIAFEGRAASGRLTTDEREMALIEPFLLADTVYARRNDEAQYGGWVFLAGIAGFFVTLAVAGRVLPSTPRWQGGTSIAYWSIFVLILLAIGLTSGRRYARRSLLPVIARSLRPLRPSREEIAAVFDRLRSGRVKVGKALRPEEVVDALEFDPA